VPADTIKSWKKGNKEKRKPIEVEGDDIINRMEQQVVAELETKGMKPY
jgi:hypothetical protein